MLQRQKIGIDIAAAGDIGELRKTFGRRGAAGLIGHASPDLFGCRGVQDGVPSLAIVLFTSHGMKNNHV